MLNSYNYLYLFMEFQFGSIILCFCPYCEFVHSRRTCVLQIVVEHLFCDGTARRCEEISREGDKALSQSPVPVGEIFLLRSVLIGYCWYSKAFLRGVRKRLLNTKEYLFCNGFVHSNSPSIDSLRFHSYMIMES